MVTLHDQLYAADPVARSQAPILTTWHDAQQAPARDQYVQIKDATWIVRDHLWLPGGREVLVFCSKMDFYV